MIIRDLFSGRRLKVVVGVALIGLAPLFSQCDWRSIVEKLHELREDTKRTVDPLELQRWAVSVFNDAQLQNSSGEIPISKIPVSVQRLRSEGMQCSRVSYNNEATVLPKDRHINISWEESGSVAWGMLVGSPEFEPEFGGSGHLVKWKPGIYFWCTGP